MDSNIDLKKQLVVAYEKEILENGNTIDALDEKSRGSKIKDKGTKESLLCIHDKLEKDEKLNIQNVNHLNASRTASSVSTQMMILVPPSSPSSSPSSSSSLSPLLSSSSLSTSPALSSRTSQSSPSSSSSSTLERDIYNEIHGSKEQKVINTIITQNNKTTVRAIKQSSDDVNAQELTQHLIQPSEFNNYNNKKINSYKNSNLLLMSNSNLQTQSSRENCNNKLDFNNLGSSENYENNYPSVEKLVQMYTTMIDKKSTSTLTDNNRKPSLQLSDTESEHIKRKTKMYLELTSNHRQSPSIIDEGCSTTPKSTYYSSDEEIINETEGGLKLQERVMRSSSSDSALGLDDDCSGVGNSGVGVSGKTSPILVEKQRRNTLTVNDIPLRPALLPLAEPTTLPTRESPTLDLAKLIESNACPVKSTMLLEAQIIKIPAPPEYDDGNDKNLRRESSQSIISDYGVDSSRVRYMRTPSVVVSDYSDEMICGITLEEMEYFKEQRKATRRLSYDDLSDLSAASSCSNLNYCGSHISSIDGLDTGGLQPPQRKISSCSTCSTISCDESDNYASDCPPEVENKPQKKKVS